MKRHSHKRRFARFGLHTIRVCIFVLIILLIRYQNVARQPTVLLSDQDVETISIVFPDSKHVDGLAIDEDRVTDSAGNTIGRFLCTSPNSDHIVGFSGPTNCLIGIDNDGLVTGVSVLSSRDTDEHIQQVVDDETFLARFQGVHIDDIGDLKMDAVSGATLSSLAIAQSVMVRLGGEVDSLKFDSSVAFDDLRRIIPSAQGIEDVDVGGLRSVVSVNGSEIGKVLLTSPFGDNIVGYQGPTKTAVVFDASGCVSGLLVLDSYDNQPYVSYVRDDEAFSHVFDGFRLGQLSELEFGDGRFDGVSGATMTSQCVVESVKEAAIASSLQRARRTRTFFSSGEIRLRDLGTIAVVIAAMVIGLTRLRGNKTLRLVFQLLLVGYLGLVNGDMLSQALIHGWSATSVPWGTATGLVFLSGAGIVVPILSRKNLYCSHLCPHGALQDLVRRKLPWQIKLGKRLRGLLTMVPGLLLAWCLIVAMLGLTFSLVDIEPFNAWVFLVAGWPTMAVAVAGFVASLFVPMAYCKFGCPTGAMLNFLRFNSSSDRWNRADTLALSMLLFAVALIVTD